MSYKVDIMHLSPDAIAQYFIYKFYEHGDINNCVNKNIFRWFDEEVDIYLSDMNLLKDDFNDIDIFTYLDKEQCTRVDMITWSDGDKFIVFDVYDDSSGERVKLFSVSSSDAKKSYGWLLLDMNGLLFS